GNVADDDEYLFEAGALRCAPTTLAGDDLEQVVFAPPYDQRFEQSVLTDGLGELFQPFVHETLTWLAGLRNDLVDRTGKDVVGAIAARGSVRRARRLRRGQQRIQSTPQSHSFHVRLHLPACPLPGCIQAGVQLGSWRFEHLASERQITLCALAFHVV